MYARREMQDARMGWRFMYRIPYPQQQKKKRTSREGALMQI